MRMPDKRGMGMFFAALVLCMFFLLPVCEAQAMAPLASSSRVAGEAGLASGYERESAVKSVGMMRSSAYSRKDAIAQASFVQKTIDPVTRENMKKAGIAPPPPPAPVEIPVPGVRDIYPMNEREVNAFVEKALEALPPREYSYDNPVEDSPLVQQLNDEQDMFKTPVDFSNIDEDNACAMPGIPGAEISGAGIEVSPETIGIQRPGGIAGAMLTKEPELPERGGEGGGEDNSGAAAYGAAKARLDYLQTISDWGYETASNGLSMMAGIAEFLDNPEAIEEYGAENLALLGSSHEWRKMADVMHGAYEGFMFTVSLYADGFGTFKKITNALLDRSGKGAGTLLYQYEGLYEKYGSDEDYRDLFNFESGIARSAAEVADLEAQIEQARADTSLTNSERRQKRAELERKLDEAKNDYELAKDGLDKKAYDEYEELEKKFREEGLSEKEQQRKNSLQNAHNAYKQYKTERKKSIAQTFKKSAEKEQQEIMKKEGLNDWESAKTYLGWETFDKKLENMLGTPYVGGGFGEGATGLYSSYFQLESVINFAEEFLDPAFVEEMKEHLKDYRERLNGLEGDMDALKQHREDSRQDRKISDKEREDHEKMQHEANAEMLDIAGDIAKDFKETINKLAKKTKDQLEAWWKKVEAKLGEVPEDPCYKDPPTGCSEDCDKAIYGRQNIVEAVGTLPPAPGMEPPPPAAPPVGAPMPGAGPPAPAGGAGIPGPAPNPPSTPAGGFVMITSALPQGPIGPPAPAPSTPAGPPVYGPPAPGPPPSPVPTGSPAACVTRERCPEFPKPAEGAGGGGGRPIAPPPNLKGIADASGSYKISGMSMPSPFVTREGKAPEEKNEDKKEKAEQERIRILDNIAKSHGLSPVAGQRGFYQDKNGNKYVVDALGIGFIPATNEAIDANDAAADAVIDAKSELTKAEERAKAPPPPEGPAPTPTPTPSPAPTPAPPSLPIPPAPAPAPPPAPEPPSVEEAQNNFNNAAESYVKTVKIPFSSYEQDIYTALTRKINTISLESVVTSTDTRAPGPSEDVDTSRNEDLKNRLKEAEHRFRKYPEFTRYAEMQKVYESMIEFGTPEADEIEALGDELTKEIGELTDEMFADSIDSYFKNLQNTVSEANNIKGEYERKINSEEKSLKLHKKFYEEASGLGDRSEMAYRLDRIDIANKRINDYVNEANSKLEPLIKKADDAKKAIEKARDDILGKLDKLAEKKRNAPGLKNHLFKDGELTDKGNQFNDLKAAEKASFAKKFSEDIMETLKDMLSRMSGAEVTGAVAQAPMSLDGVDIPVLFDANGLVVKRKLHEFVPGGTSIEIERKSQKRDFDLDVKKSAPDFRILLKVMKVKGNRLKSAHLVLNRFNSIHQVITETSAAWHEAMDAVLLDKDGNVRKEWLGESGKKQSLAGDLTSLISQYSSGIGQARKSAQGTIGPPIPAPAAPSFYGPPAPITGGFAAITGAAVSGQGSEKPRPMVEAAANFRKALENDIASMGKLVEHIQKDVEQEIRDSGFSGYRFNALMWAGGQMSDADFLKSLKESEKEVSELAAGLSEIYDELRDAKKAKFDEIWGEHEQKLKNCGADTKCIENVKKETGDRLKALDEEYNPKIAKALEELRSAIAGDSEAAAAFKEIQELRNEAEEKIIQDDILRLEREEAIASGDYQRAIETDESYGLKSLSFMEGNIFEKWDNSAKEESRRISESLKKGANILDNLRKELNSRGLNLDVLLKDASWRSIDGSNPEAVTKWINGINDFLGLTGKNRIDISGYSDNELKDLGFYWNTFGNTIAKQVDGSYTPADTARGYLITGQMKHDAGDLEGAMRDMQSAVFMGEGSLVGGKARVVLEEIGNDQMTRLIQRTIADLIIDPLNYLTLGAGLGAKVIGALGKGAKFAKELSIVGRGIDKAADIGKGIGKAIKTGIEAIPGGKKVLGAADFVRGGKSAKEARGAIKGMKETLDGLRREKAAAEATGDFGKAGQLSAKGEQVSADMRAAGSALKESNFWTKPRHILIGKPRGQATLEGLANKMLGELTDAARAGRETPDSFRKLASHFDDVKKARDALRAGAGPGLFAGKSFKKASEQAAKHLDDAIRNVNDVLRGGGDIPGSVNRMNDAANMFQNAQQANKGYRYMNMFNRAGRAYNNFMDNAYNAFLGRARPPGVQNAMSNLGYAEDALGGAIRSGDANQVRNAFGFVENAQDSLRQARISGAVVLPPRAFPPRIPPAFTAPKQSADDLLKRLDDLVPDEAARRAEQARDDARLLDKMGDSRGARNARERAAVLEQPIARERPPVRLEERPAVVIPKREVPREVPRMSPEDARARLLEGTDVRQERFATFRIEKDGKFKPATHDEVDKLLREKMGLSDDFVISDELRNANVKTYGDELGIKSYDQVRYKKGNQWISEDEASVAMRQNAEREINAMLDEGRGATRQAYDNLVDELNVKNRQYGFEENWRVVDENGRPVIYVEDTRIGTMDDLVGKPEGKIFSDLVKKNKLEANRAAIDNALDARAERIAKERGISVEQAKYEEASKLYEGQQLRLDDLRHRAADFRAEGKFDEAGKLNTEYRKLAMEEDALFDVKVKVRAEAERLAVPSGISENEANVVKAIHSAKGDDVVRAVGDDVGSKLARMIPEDDAKNLGKQLAEATKEICSCPTTVGGVRAKIRENVKDFLEKNPEVLAKNNLKLTDDLIDDMAGEIMRSKAKQFGVGKEMLAEVLQDARITPDEVEVYALGKSLVGSHADEAGEFADDARRIEGALRRPVEARSLEETIIEGVAKPESLLSKKGVQANTYVIEHEGAKQLVKEIRSIDRISQMDIVKESMRLKEVEDVPNIPRFAELIIQDTQTGKMELITDLGGLEKKLFELNKAYPSSEMFVNKKVYMVTNVVEGKGKLGTALTLEDYLEIPGNKITKQAYDDLARNIDAVHKRGVVHNDIHERNVLVDADGNMHLIDFGLAQTKKSLGGAVFESALHDEAYKLDVNIKKFIDRTDAWAGSIGASPAPEISQVDNALKKILGTEGFEKIRDALPAKSPPKINPPTKALEEAKKLAIEEGAEGKGNWIQRLIAEVKREKATP